MKTIADMPIEEHEKCVGMWCDFEATPGYVITTIIIKAGNDLEFEDEYEVFNPIIGHEIAHPEQITPRFDLPRACSSDGKPPAGEWEYDYIDSDGYTLTTGEEVDCAAPHQEIRRWLGYWEQA